MSKSQQSFGVLFSDVFGVDPLQIEEYGAFNISLVADLPLFIDPFLLFQSVKPEYQALHDEIIRYLRFLRDKTVSGQVTDGLLKAWFHFKEVDETWLGFTESGNRGSGLGMEFARALRTNFGALFGDGEPTVTKSHHLEKLSLIADGVGRDCISDFTTNLIKDFLCSYTEDFARDHVEANLRRDVVVNRAKFDYRTETWQHKTYNLPVHSGSHVLLVPKDILTRDQTWINGADMIQGVEYLPEALPDDAIRAQVENYFIKMLPKEPQEPTADERRNAARQTLLAYPELVDYFIKEKEDTGEEAKSVSDEKVEAARLFFTENLPKLIKLVHQTEFYDVPGDSYSNALKRAHYLRQVIENNDGYRLFWDKDGEPIRREYDMGTLFRLTWFGTAFDYNAEVNNGRGPVDGKASKGKFDKSLIEFKLAKNTGLKRNLQKQVEIYEKANETASSVKVILYFDAQEQARVETILDDLRLTDAEHVVLIDARDDNKPSASTAR